MLRKEDTLRHIGRARHVLHARYYFSASRSGGLRDLGHYHVGHGYAGSAPMAQAAIGKGKAPSVGGTPTRQKIADGHPCTVGSVEKQRITHLELLLHCVAARTGAGTA